MSIRLVVRERICFVAMTQDMMSTCFYSIEMSFIIFILTFVLTASSY